MNIPSRIPGYRILLSLFGVYAAIWIALEGHLVQVVALGLFAAFMIMLALIQRFWGGKALTIRRWLFLCMLSGLWLGVGSLLLTLLFMTLKSGLHSHGWEYSLTETEWVFRQFPLWSVGGLFLGFGVGLVIVGAGGNKTDQSPNL